MKKLIFLSLTLLTASLGAMEGQPTKEQEQEKLALAKAKEVPSLVELCTNKIIEHAESFENPEEILEQIPNLSANAACAIIAEFPQDIINANALLLKRYLLEELNPKPAFKVNPAVKGAIVRQIAKHIEPSIALDLFDKVFDSNNTHPDRHVFGCALFECYKELQTWENIIKLAEIGPITIEAAEIAFESVDNLNIGATIGQLITMSLDNYNKELFKQALLNLTHTPFFLFELLTSELTDPIENKENYSLNQQDNKASICDLQGNQLAIFDLENTMSALDFAVSKDEKLFLLITSKDGETVNLCLIYDRDSKKIAYGAFPKSINNISFDTNNNCIGTCLDSTQYLIELPLYYFMGKTTLTAAALLYMYQELNSNALNLQSCHGVTSSYDKLSRVENKQISGSDLTEAIIRQKYIVNILNEIIEEKDPQRLKNEVLVMLQALGSIPSVVEKLKYQINELQKHIANPENAQFTEVLAIQVEQGEKTLEIIEIARELGIIDEIEREMTQENKTEEHQ